MESELRGFRAGGGGRLEFMEKGDGPERWGGCLWAGAVGSCGMGVVGGGLMWGMAMGAGGSGCSRGGCGCCSEEAAGSTGCATCSAECGWDGACVWRGT